MISWDGHWRSIFCPLRYGNPDRLSSLLELQSETFNRLARLVGAENVLSARIMEKLGPAGAVVTDFSSPLRRLALQPLEALVRCGRIAALSLRISGLRTGLAGTEFREMASDMSEAELFQAMELDGLAGEAPLARAEFSAQPLDQAALSLLMAWLMSEPDDIRERVFLRFPPGVEPISCRALAEARDRLATAAQMHEAGHD